MVQLRRFYIFAVLIFLTLLLLFSKYLLLDRAPELSKQLLSPDHLDRQNCSSTDWSRFAYVQYVTDLPYLCNSLMIFESLSRLGCKPDRLMMYPTDFQLDGNSTVSRHLRKAKEEYGVRLQPITVQARLKHEPTWAGSYTKLLAFNQTDYQRVLHLDSDSTVLQCMDELFLLQPAFVAMPRAYWLGFEKRILSSQLLLLQPSQYEFDRVMKATEEAGDDIYDMDILTGLYKDSALILPHRPYNLLTAELRGTEHEKYMGDTRQNWDPDMIMRETKHLHFSDWPLPKPWLALPALLEDARPACGGDPATNQSPLCRSIDVWIAAYED